MTPPPVQATETVRLSPSRDGRLAPYGLIALGGLGAALLAGQPPFAALAAPFVLALALGLRRTGPVEVTARVVVDSDRVLEGDEITGRLHLEWDGAFDAQIMLHRLKALSPSPDAERSWCRPGVRSVEVPIRLRAGRWGRHSVGEIWVRLKAPLGLLVWTGKVMTGPEVRVLPGLERLNRLLNPSRSRAVWGMHLSRRLGDGHEFAEIHPYTPGDRLRDLNWAATARFDRPFVNRHHPELSGDVVIVVDPVDDGSAASVETLERVGRVAWALASRHLRANDRVGVLGLGFSTQWLPPTGGRIARYGILDTLLRIGGDAADPTAFPDYSRAVPPARLVLVLTTLQNRATVGALESWRSRGRSVAVFVIDPSDILDPPQSDAERLARRVWKLRLDRRRSVLRRNGIPVVTATATGPLTPAVLALRRARRARSVRRR